MLDTSVVVRLAQPTTPSCKAVLNTLDELGQQGYEFCIVPQVIYEYWVVVTRPLANNGLAFSADDTTLEIAKLASLFTVLRDERTVFEHWQQLVTSYKVIGKNAHDARIVAAMHRHGINDLLTLNPKDFRRYAKINLLGVLPTTGN
ncbi:type II toxin-antitoxin system VapC family toxin [Rubripirellula obstinata]|uniref:type II toxin-antitoxin system VapC family toxin n=1 Tax=Rubripirellula obstinata TaxID=406547 RepID=UPI00135A73B0|nr:type II toxin-antitoxin system VapC family toxin [Rubripirellula obstinata]